MAAELAYGDRSMPRSSLASAGLLLVSPWQLVNLDPCRAPWLERYPQEGPHRYDPSWWASCFWGSWRAEECYLFDQVLGPVQGEEAPRGLALSTLWAVGILALD